jgi:hypothetical protein
LVSELHTKTALGFATQFNQLNGVVKPYVPYLEKQWEMALQIAGRGLDGSV